MQDKKPTLDDLTVLNAELAALVRARIPLEPELHRLATQLPRGAAALAKRLAARLEAGEDLESAIAAEGNRLPETYRAVVAAGLASGNLPAALEGMAVSTGRLADIRRTTGVALIVPVIVVVLASLMLSVLLTILADDFAWIAPRELAPWQAWVESPTLRWVLGTLIPIAALLVPLVWWLRTNVVGGRAATQWSLLGWIPGVGKMQRWGDAATFAEVLRAMLAGDVPLQRALRVAGDATAWRGYRQAAYALAEVSQKGGDLAAPNLDAARRRLPPLVRTALRQVKHRKLLLSTLGQASRHYQSRAQAQRDFLTNYVPALLTFGIGGTVAALYTLGLMWPYTHMLKTMADGMWR